METGNNIQLFFDSSPKKSIEALNAKHLIFQLHPLGLNCLVEGEQNSIQAIYKWSWAKTSDESQLITNLQHCLNSKSLLGHRDLDCLWVLSFPNFCFYPSLLFKEEERRAILELGTQVHSTDIIYSQEMLSKDTQLIYSLSFNVLKWLEQNFPDAQITHQADLWDKFSQNLDSIECFLHLEETYFELYIGSREKLLFYKQHYYKTKEELLYWMLQSFEAQQILATEVNLFVSGELNLTEESLDLLKRYIGNVSSYSNNYPLASADLSRDQLRRVFNLWPAL